jgi:hypothetical protein
MPETVPVEERYRRALQWIRATAGLHYFGAAFEPEHMRDLANVAADALDLRWSAEGTRLHEDLPDYEAAMEQAKISAREWAAGLGLDLAGESDPDEWGLRHQDGTIENLTDRYEDDAETVARALTEPHRQPPGNHLTLVKREPGGEWEEVADG